MQREGLTQVWGIENVKTYLYGKGFVLETIPPAPALYEQKRARKYLKYHELYLNVRKDSKNIGAEHLSQVSCFSGIFLECIVYASYFDTWRDLAGHISISDGWNKLCSVSFSCMSVGQLSRFVLFL